MNRIRVRVQGCGCAAIEWIGLLTILTAGCASWTASIPRTEDIAKKRQARTEEAVRRFDEQRNWAELESARGLRQQGDLDSSIETLVRLLDRSPADVEARLLLAESLLAADRASEGISYLEPATAARPNDARLHHMMGSLMDVIGQTGDAVVFYRQATQLEPDNDVYAVSYQTAVGSDEVSDGVSGELKAEEFSAEPIPAARNVRAADSKVPGPSRPTPLVAPEPVAAGAERASSVRVIDSAESDDSSSQVARPSASELLKRGSSAMLAGQSDLALAHFREAIALEPHDPQIPITAAVSALRHNHPNVAVALLEPSREAFAESAAIRRILGTAYYRLGDHESSQVALQQALSLDKSSALSYFLMGCTLVKLGQPAVAETHFRQARTLDPRYALGR